jgi:hypothetical protein
MSPRKIAAVVVAAVAAVVIAVAALWHGIASFEIARSRDNTLPLVEQVDAARIARNMEPFDRATRAQYGLVLGELQLRDGDVLHAEATLAAAYRDAVGDQEILTFFQHVQDVLAVDSNRKAHLQHGHEGPGGTLRPQDVEH